MFNDLKQAIHDVLAYSCTPASGNDSEREYRKVDLDKLRILQAEYNIHFVEPEDEQLDIL